jgi:chemotaxis protein methyltransferase CheR
MTAATDTLRGFVRARAGISMNADKEYLLKSRLEPHLKGWGIDSLERLATHLHIDPVGRVAKEVVAALTINETLWFRDGKPFDQLKSVIVPSVIGRTTDRNLSIWSAACSTGQEAYSIAMVMQELRLMMPGWGYSVLGTDICDAVVARARIGSYSKFEIQRGLPVQRLVKSFNQTGEDWSIKQELKEHVTFQTMNLMQIPPHIGPFDVVFCRNVLIYFEVDVKAKVLAAIARRMRPNGYLILGSAETTLGVSSLFSTVPGTTGLYRLNA